MKIYIERECEIPACLALIELPDWHICAVLSMSSFSACGAWK
jgi:hypothetical protein